MAIADQKQKTCPKSKPQNYELELVTEATLASVQQLVEAELDQDAQRQSDSAGQAGKPSSKNVFPDLKISIIIPAYNEQETILQVISKVRRLPLNKEIIVIDDASTDETLARLESVRESANLTILRNDSNQGKGAAVRKGIEAAGGDVVVVQDADLEYDCNEITGLIHPIACGKADVVYGSRFLYHENANSSWLHRLGNTFLTSFSNFMTGLNLTDMETCYKVIRKSSLRRVTIQENRFGLEPELTAKLSKEKARFVEMPISYNGRDWKEGKKIGMKDLFRALYCIVRYRF